MKSVTVIEDLPLRPRKLSDADVSEIFGGCKTGGQACSKDSDCCGQAHGRRSTGCGHIGGTTAFWGRGVEMVSKGKVCKY